MTGLASSGFARHYYRNHYCFLFLWVLRCFTSPRSLTPPYIFRRESPGTHAPWRGFPIRTSSDHSSFINSPRLIADYYVLLRLQMPRHPPFALRNLKSHKYQRKNHHHHPHQKGAGNTDGLDHTTTNRLWCRCSRPLCSSQRTTDPTRQNNTFLPDRSETPSPPPPNPKNQMPAGWSLRTQ